jgi:hypothetical protein
MRRREFIRHIGGAVATWPLAARAQQASKIYRVGLFFSSTPPAELAGPDPIIPPARAFLHGLRDLGYIEGRNLILERRTAEGKFERIPEIAAELVGRNPDAVVTGDFVLINYKFVHRWNLGRQFWLDGVVTACEALGIRHCITRHEFFRPTLCDECDLAVHWREDVGARSEQNRAAPKGQPSSLV